MLVLVLLIETSCFFAVRVAVFVVFASAPHCWKKDVAYPYNLFNFSYGSHIS